MIIQNNFKPLVTDNGSENTALDRWRYFIKPAYRHFSRDKNYLNYKALSSEYSNSYLIGICLLISKSMVLQVFELYLFCFTSFYELSQCLMKFVKIPIHDYMHVVCDLKGPCKLFTPTQKYSLDGKNLTLTYIGWQHITTNNSITGMLTHC